MPTKTRRILRAALLGIIQGVLCLFALRFVGCEAGGSSAVPQAKLELGFGTLQKVDDYPLYVMTYEGDYGFAEFLRTGRRPSLAAAAGSRHADAPWGCTCFAATGNDETRKFGRNFDWRDCVPMLLYTKPSGAYASVSMVDLEYFGFNRNNLPDVAADKMSLRSTPYMPFDGMNEKGVAVGMMAVSAASGPYDPGRVTIDEIEAIRLILDYATSVDEAIQLLSKYNIRFVDPPIHYLIADRSGNSVVVEFIEGEIITLRNTEPWQVSTNFIIYASQAPMNAPCWRYDTAYRILSDRRGVVTDAAAINLLSQVSQVQTIWSVLYDMKAGNILVAPGREFGSLKEFHLNMSAK